MLRLLFALLLLAPASAFASATFAKSQLEEIEKTATETAKAASQAGHTVVTGRARDLAAQAKSSAATIENATAADALSLFMTLRDGHQLLRDAIATVADRAERESLIGHLTARVKGLRYFVTCSHWPGACSGDAFDVRNDPTSVTCNPDIDPPSCARAARGAEMASLSFDRVEEQARAAGTKGVVDALALTLAERAAVAAAEMPFSSHAQADAVFMDVKAAFDAFRNAVAQRPDETERLSLMQNITLGMRRARAAVLCAYWPIRQCRNGLGGASGGDPGAIACVAGVDPASCNSPF